MIDIALYFDENVKENVFEYEEKYLTMKKATFNN